MRVVRSELVVGGVPAVQCAVASARTDPPCADHPLDRTGLGRGEGDERAAGQGCAAAFLAAGVEKVTLMHCFNFVCVFGPTIKPNVISVMRQMIR